MAEPDSPPLTCGVMIATHNRSEDLERTLRALEALSPQPHEILVCADGCDDGTEQLVREIAPRARLLVNPTARGSVKARNQLMREANSKIVLSLDDDSYPVETDFIARTTELFEKDDSLGVVSFPQRSDEFPESLTATDFGPAQNVGSYWDSGAAIRRDLFLRLGGYMSMFFHAYEEPDYAVRCIAAGGTIRYEPSLRVRHHYSGVQRSEIRTHQRHSRNELWSVVMRCPMPMLIPVAAFRVIRQFGYACSRGPAWVVREPRWWCSALVGILKPLRERHPIPWPKYRRWMQLVRKPEPLP